MKRRNFLVTSAALSASSLLPINLLSEPLKKENKRRFPTQLIPEINGCNMSYPLGQNHNYTKQLLNAS